MDNSGLHPFWTQVTLLVLINLLLNLSVPTKSMLPTKSNWYQLLMYLYTNNSLNLYNNIRSTKFVPIGVTWVPNGPKLLLIFIIISCIHLIFGYDNIFCSSTNYIMILSLCK